MLGRNPNKMLSDPATLRNALLVKTKAGPAKLGKLLLPFQKQALACLDAAVIALTDGKQPAIGKHWWEWSKGCSKTTLVASELLWYLLRSKSPIEVRCGAGDEEQASEVITSIKSFVQENSWLAGLIEVMNTQVKNRLNGGTITAVTSDSKTAHGGRPDATFIDEFAHVISEDFVDALTANQAKLGGLMIVATNAGYRDSWAWKKREAFQKSGLWNFSIFNHPAPWLSAKELAEKENGFRSQQEFK